MYKHKTYNNHRFLRCSIFCAALLATIFLMACVSGCSTALASECGTNYYVRADNSVFERDAVSLTVALTAAACPGILAVTYVIQDECPEKKSLGEKIAMFSVWTLFMFVLGVAAAEKWQ